MNVLVYGTLLTGEHNNYLLAESKKVGDTIVLGLEMHNLGSFPACVTEKDKSIVGEVWEIDEKTLKRLDWLEGYPDFYDRIEVDTHLGKAWVYVCENARGKPIIESGNWRIK